MKIRKMKNQITIEGLRFFKDEVVVIDGYKIVIINIEDLSADKVEKIGDMKLATILENSIDIPIG